ncbi:MAG: hypothetical protein AAB577_02065 [Patescibacteria group bacterium]
MARTIEKNRALKLRQKGKSINEIAENLNIPKSTVSLWCRDIKLTPTHIERLAKRQRSGSYKGRMKFLERIRGERLEQVNRLRKDGLQEIGIVNKRDLFIAGIAMYWSEGVTSPNSDEVSFSNSDAKMVLLMKRWFKEICGLSSNQIVIQVRINRMHKHRIREIENYWSKLTRLPLDQFTKTILIKSKLKKVYPKGSVYYGTIRMKIRRGTRLRRKINGWVEGLAMPG